MLKEKIKKEIKLLFEKKQSISVTSMKLFYIISEIILEINTNSNFNHNENKIYNLSSQCVDNIECFLNNAFSFNNYYTEEEITDIINKLIIVNIKYL